MKTRFDSQTAREIINQCFADPHYTYFLTVLTRVSQSKEYRVLTEEGLSVSINENDAFGQVLFPNGSKIIIKERFL